MGWILGKKQLCQRQTLQSRDMTELVQQNLVQETNCSQITYIAPNERQAVRQCFPYSSVDHPLDPS